VLRARITGTAVAAAPTVKQHELDIPRIGYIHSWQRTQDEGWVRAALDTYGVPYTYFADSGCAREPPGEVRRDHLSARRRDGAESQVNGIAMTGSAPIPVQADAGDAEPRGVDESDDIRGGMGFEGLMELRKFVEAGGTLIVEGSTSTIFPEYHLTNGVTVETPANLFVRGSVMRGLVTDRTSPIAYGYAAQVPVYFNTAPVLNAGGAGAGGLAGFGGGGGPAARTRPRWRRRSRSRRGIGTRSMRLRRAVGLLRGAVRVARAGRAAVPGRAAAPAAVVAVVAVASAVEPRRALARA
jgi:hypothetical protein